MGIYNLEGYPSFGDANKVREASYEMHFLVSNMTNENERILPGGLVRHFEKQNPDFVLSKEDPNFQIILKEAYGKLLPKYIQETGRQSTDNFDLKDTGPIAKQKLIQR